MAIGAARAGDERTHQRRAQYSCINFGKSKLLTLMLY